jgi:type IV pilus assembly protein PilA
MLARSRGFSLIELLIAVSIVLILAAIAVPNLLRTRSRANEAAAVVNLQSIGTAEMIYAISYPQVGYAPTLAKLGEPDGNAPPSQEAAGLLSSSLACPSQPCAKGGYYYELYDVQGTPAATFFMRARPVVVGRTGERVFKGSDATRIAVDSHDSVVVIEDGKN